MTRAGEDPGDPPPRVLEFVKWSALMLLASLVVAAISIPLLRLFD